MRGIGSHTAPVRGATNEWLTPPHIIERLGPFDLDPCSADPMPWRTAARMLWHSDDGLSANWEGRVWLNPLYGTEAVKWLAKLADHGDGIAILFARTETEMFRRYVWERAHSVFFFYGRLHFHRPDGTRAKGNAGGPSCLISYGTSNTARIRASGLVGCLCEVEEVA